MGDKGSKPRAESTVAIGLARLGHSVEWVGAVGDDEIGTRVLRDLAAEGVGTAYARTDATAPTGFMIRERATPLLTRVIYYRRDSAGSRLRATDAIAALDAGADILHLSGVTLLLSESNGEAARGAVAHAGRSAYASPSTSITERLSRSAAARPSSSPNS